jgi:hypothetical protein
MRFLALLLPFLLLMPVVDNGKGMAGHTDGAYMTEQGASWFHHWSPCWAWEDKAYCVDAFKGRWTLEEHSEFYGDLIALFKRVAYCESGWFLVGDEWELQGWSMQEQVDELHWFVQLRDALNEECKIAFGGVLVWHPYTGHNAEWVQEFYDAYQATYGTPPPVDAIAVDDYAFEQWYGRDWEQDTARMHDAIKATYGDDVQVWAREIGCLISHECALDSIYKLPRIIPYYDRYAWFVSSVQPGGDWEYTAAYVGGEITDIGEAYRDMGRFYLAPVLLPIIVR